MHAVGEVHVQVPGRAEHDLGSGRPSPVGVTRGVALLVGLGFDDPGQCRCQIILPKRLGKPVKVGRDGVHIRITGNDQHRERRSVRTQPTGQVRARHSGHQVIRDHQIGGRAVGEAGNRFLRRVGFDDRIAKVGQHFGRACPDGLLVVDQQDNA